MTASSDGWIIPLKMSAEIEQNGAESAVAFASAPLLLHPRGIEYATKCINHCHAHGIIAAFIIIVDGVLWIGASIEQLQRVARQITDAPPLIAEPRRIATIAASDIPIAMQYGWSGGLQTAGTVAMAHLAGIRACAAATIEQDDLYELSRYPLAVVSAGIGGGADADNAAHANNAAGIGNGAGTAADAGNGNGAASSVGAASLTMARTLASYQLPLIGYRCGSLPPFARSSGGVSVSGRVEQAAEIAELFRITRLLNRQRALLISHPAPPFSANEISGTVTGFANAPLASGESTASSAAQAGALAEAHLDALLQSAELAAEIVAALMLH